MISTSVQHAQHLLPEIKLPLLVIGMISNLPRWIERVDTEEQYLLAIQGILMVDARVHLVLTSLTGDSPTAT